MDISFPKRVIDPYAVVGYGDSAPSRLEMYLQHRVAAIGVTVLKHIVHDFKQTPVQRFKYSGFASNVLFELVYESVT